MDLSFSSCLVSRGTNCHLLLIIFSSMFVEQIALEDRDRGSLWSKQQRGDVSLQSKSQANVLTPFIKNTSFPSSGFLSCDAKPFCVRVTFICIPQPCLCLGWG